MHSRTRSRTGMLLWRRAVPVLRNVSAPEVPVALSVLVVACIIVLDLTRICFLRIARLVAIAVVMRHVSGRAAVTHAGFVSACVIVRDFPAGKTAIARPDHIAVFIVMCGLRTRRACITFDLAHRLFTLPCNAYILLSASRRTLTANAPVSFIISIPLPNASRCSSILYAPQYPISCSARSTSSQSIVPV